MQQAISQGRAPVRTSHEKVIFVRQKAGPVQKMQKKNPLFV